MYLDYVQLEMTLDTTYRGRVSIDLISPSNTISTILSNRPEDSSSDGFVNWSFTTVHMWGESPDGLWKIKIRKYFYLLKLNLPKFTIFDLPLLI